jgi:hypothetical protein
MSMLRRMANTDILAGMHGAGLAHAVYLQPGTLWKSRIGAIEKKNFF